jgi:hypothetical protein
MRRDLDHQVVARRDHRAVVVYQRPDGVQGAALVSTAPISEGEGSTFSVEMPAAAS